MHSASLKSANVIKGSIKYLFLKNGACKMITEYDNEDCAFNGIPQGFNIHTFLF